jgi:hypothetical protein
MVDLFNVFLAYHASTIFVNAIALLIMMELNVKQNYLTRPSVQFAVTRLFVKIAYHVSNVKTMQI